MAIWQYDSSEKARLAQELEQSSLFYGYDIAHTFGVSSKWPKMLCIIFNCPINIF